MLAIQNQVPILSTILKNRERRHTSIITRSVSISNQGRGHSQQEIAASSTATAPDATNNNVQNNLDFSKPTLVRKESPKSTETVQFQDKAPSPKISEQSNCIIS